jgi:hypothetical protein
MILPYKDTEHRLGFHSLLSAPSKLGFPPFMQASLLYGMKLVKTQWSGTELSMQGLAYDPSLPPVF